MSSKASILPLILIVAGLLRLLGLGNNLFATLPSSALNQVSAELRLSLSDPRGLHAPFVLFQNGLILLFGSPS